MPFGLWLKRLRKTADLTQEALAERTGCSTEMVRRIDVVAAGHPGRLPSDWRCRFPRPSVLRSCTPPGTLSTGSG